MGIPARPEDEPECRLVLVCIHEAAHAVIATQFGGKARRVRIGRGARFGTGLCVVRMAYGSEPEQRRQMGLAGRMADLLAMYGAYLPVSLAAWMLRQGMVSRQDMALIDGMPTDDDIKACIASLRALWGAVIALASELLETELGHYQAGAAGAGRRRPASLAPGAARVAGP